MHRQKKYSGFTLIEILVVVGLIAILAAITIVAINPAKNFAQTRDAQRSSDVTAILNGITQYTSEEGNTIEGFLAAAGLGVPDSDTDGELADEIECGSNPIYIGTGLDTADDDSVTLTGNVLTAATDGTNDDEQLIDIADGISGTALLVDEYIVAIPVDPSQSTTAAGITNTVYQMCVTTGGRVTITATPERATSISVSR